MRSVGPCLWWSRSLPRKTPRSPQIALWTRFFSRSRLCIPMDAASLRHATAASRDVLPACPECGTVMVVRAQWSGGRVTGLYWGCRRAPGCEGTRRIKSADLIRPVMYDASAQAIFDWESSRDGHLSHRLPAAAAPAPTGGLRGLLSRVGSRAEAYE